METTCVPLVGGILKSMERTFVHKSIEKTQKFKYFWVFFEAALKYANAFLSISAAGLSNGCELPQPMPTHAQAVCIG